MFATKSIHCLLFLVPCFSRGDVTVELDWDRVLKPVKQPSPSSPTLEILQNVLTEASSPFIEVSETKTTNGQENNKEITSSRLKWKGCIRKSLRNIAGALRSTSGMALDALAATIAAAAMAATTVDQEARSSTGETCPLVSSEIATLKVLAVDKPNAKIDVDDDNDMSFDSETIQGAKLISASFGLLGNTFGLIADSIRISGDTAAGIFGSTVKVVGSGVQSLSSSFHSAGRMIEPTQAHRGRKRLTSERLLYKKERKLAGGEDENFERRTNGILLNSRHIASKGMRLMGNVVRGLGDSLVLVGGATETLASSTVGLAEDSIRIFEDAADSIAASLIPKVTKKLQKTKPKESVTIDNDEATDRCTPSYFSFGSSDHQRYSNEEPQFVAKEGIESDENFAMILDRFIGHVIEFISFVFSEINGVPSLAPEIFGILGLCYLTCLYSTSLLLRQKKSKMYAHVPRLPAPFPSGNIPLCPTRVSLFKRVFSLLVIPMKTILSVPFCVYRITFDRRTFLLFLFTFAWAYLSWASQIRSIAIQRHAEGKGFRSAISSIGTTVPSRSEPVLWVNALMNQIWQTHGPESPKQTHGQSFPIFVERAMNGSWKNGTCHSCPNDNCSQECFKVNGGLEPVLAGVIGNYFMNVFRASNTSAPTDVAYVSIHSITLGSQPPLIRGIEYLGKEYGGQRYEYELDVLVLFEDMEIILDVKLSNLDYALLPSTKISAHSFEAVLPLKVSVSSTPGYPYISTLHFSLSKSPECNIRITPLSDDSGLRGIDLGSLPLIREWVKRAIHDTVSDYVAPKFVSFDYAAWMTSTPETTVAIRPDENRRRRTIQRPTVVDTKPSRQSASNTAFFNDKHIYTSLVRPKTELSKLGMQRWLAKIDDPALQHDEDHLPEVMRPLPRIIAQPLALLSPILLAVAASVFRANTASEPNESE